MGARTRYRVTGQIFNFASWLIGVVVVWSAFDLTRAQGWGLVFLSWALLPVVE